MSEPVLSPIARGSLAWDRTHRARRIYHYPVSALVPDVIVVVVATLAVWWLLGAIVPVWVEIFNFWSDRSGLDARMQTEFGARTWGLVPPTSTRALTVMPSGTVWWVTAILTTLAWFVSGRMPPERMPFKYLLRLVLIIEFSALAYFYFWPASLPTPVHNYLSDLIRQSAGFMLLLPVLFGLTLFPFALPLRVKVGAVAGGVMFLAVVTPLQAASSAWLLHHTSVMAMPVLYLFFGLLPQVMALMGIYGYALSLLPPDDELMKRGLLRA